MQIPIFEGCYVDQAGEFRSSYPHNLAPVAKKTGFSAGYFRTAEGIATLCALSGRDRGGIEWNGVHYRVAGSKLISVSDSGAVTVLGDVGDNGLDAVFTYSFDRLAIASAGILWYYQPSSGIAPVTDPDIGMVNWVLWIGGYFAVTDGTTIAVTELNDPFSVNPLKYGSAEESPDEIMMLLRISGQLVAVGRLTCEFFQNIGGNLFPFQRMQNALIERGAVSRFACALYNQTFAFVGSAINEELAVYMAGPGQTIKISTREVETAISEIGGAPALRNLKIETRVSKDMQLLYVHLPSKTYVYDINATAVFGIPIWYCLTSGTDGASPYRGRNFVYTGNKWVCGDQQQNQLGYLSNTDTKQFGARVPWRFDTIFLQNEGMGALLHQIGLVHNAGAPGSPAVLWLQMSDDGRNFTQQRAAGTIKTGQSTARSTWLRNGRMRDRRILRFSGVNDVPDSFVRVDAEAEPLGA